MLILGQGLLAPSAANGSGHRGRAQAGESVSSPGAPSGGEGSAASGEGTSKQPGESEPPSASGTPTPAGAGASSEGRVARASACQPQITVDPTSVTAGESVTVVGSLACAAPASAASGQPVTLYQHSDGTPGFQLAGTAVSEAGGAFHLATEALDVSSVFYVADGGARSANVRVVVSPLVTVSGPPTGAQLFLVRRDFAASAGPTSTVTFTGAVTPEEAGARVVLEREYGNEDWLRVAESEVGAGGEYSITHTFGIPGDARVRVVARDHGHTGVSETLTYQISRPQNRRLTIQASTPSLTYGQALTVSGMVNGGGRVALTLLASSADGAFAPVASTISEADGSYVFASQTPLQDTWYRVLDGRAGSTMLLASVKPALTVQVSQTSVTEGKPVTFTGSLTPARAGQRVDLERQSPNGVGFNVVEEGTVEASGSFSIEHVLSGEGTQQFRVLVPGGRAMQTVASAPLAVQVTSAPLEPLLP